MKLVELLAQELSEWPSKAGFATQDKDGEVRFMGGCGTGHDFYLGILADYDDSTVKYGGMRYAGEVTESQWQAERDRQNGGEWKRHRGGKQPVADDVRVEVKLRDGDIQEEKASAFLWNHSDCDVYANIMQYRVISQPQAEEVEVNDIYAVDNTDHGQTEMKWTESKTDQIDGPIKWRDTIIHCQAIIEDCEREIERNIQQLAEEGFLMIAPITDVCAVDMNDWRNWKDGDKIRMTADDWCDLSKGEVYEIIDKGRDYITILDDVHYRRKLDVDGETMFDDGRLVDFEFVSSP